MQTNGKVWKLEKLLWRHEYLLRPGITCINVGDRLRDASPYTKGFRASPLYNQCRLRQPCMSVGKGPRNLSNSFRTDLLEYGQTCKLGNFWQFVFVMRCILSSSSVPNCGSAVVGPAGAGPLMLAVRHLDAFHIDVPVHWS